MSLLSGTIACLRAGRQCGARVFLLLPPLRGKANSVRHKSCPLAEKPTVLRSFGSLTAASPWFAAAGEKKGRKSRKPLMERPPAKIEPNSIGSCTCILRTSLQPENQVVYHRFLRGEG